MTWFPPVGEDRCEKVFKKYQTCQVVVARDFNPSARGSEAGRSLEFETSLVYAALSGTPELPTDIEPCLEKK